METQTNLQKLISQGWREVIRYKNFRVLANNNNVCLFETVDGLIIGGPVNTHTEEEVAPLLSVIIPVTGESIHSG